MLEQAVRVVAVAEQLALPQRVVGVLHRQRRPVGGAGPRPGRVGGGQVRGPAGPSTSRRRRCGAGRSTSTCSSRAEAEQPGPQRQLGGQVERLPAAAAATAARQPASVTGSTGSAQSSVGRASRIAGTGSPSASAKTVRSASCRPTTSRQRRGQRGPVEVAVAAAARPGCCRRRWGLPAGRRNHSRCCANDSGTRSGRVPRRSAAGRGRRRRAGRAGAASGRRRSGASNSARTGSSDAERRADPADQPGGQQRVAAEVEEVVVDARPGRRPSTSANRSRTGSPRAAVAGRGRRRPGGRSGAGSAAAVELAVGGQRQRVQHARPRPAPCSPAAAGEARRAARPRLRRRRRRPRDHVGRPGAGRRGCPRGRRTAPRATAGCAASGRLDLAGLDPEAADLHLVVGAAEELQLPVAGVHRTRSPVRYIRSPAAPNGQATNRSAVRPGRPR